MCEIEYGVQDSKDDCEAAGEVPQPSPVHWQLYLTINPLLHPNPPLYSSVNPPSVPWLSTTANTSGSSFLHRIASGAYYEAHQQLRVIASRYVKAENWPAAIDVLFEGAAALLRAGQGGSGGDLGRYLLDVYGKAEVPVGGEGKGSWNIL